MQSVEVTAKSLDEAKKSAAERLGVAADQIEFAVLEETKGLFGKTTVRVKATALEPAAPPAAAPAPAAAKVEAPPATEPEQAGAEEAAAKPRRGRTPRTPKAAAPEEAPAAEEVAAPEAGGSRDDSGPEVVATEEDAEKLANLLREIVASGDLEVTVKPAGVSGRYVNLVLDGKDVAFLVGKHGEVLNALQYLVNIIGNRKLTAGVRATLDGNDYRKRREDTLTQLAVNIAEQVKKRGEEAVLDALPAFERRIVHKALSTVTGISTYSEGEEPNRRVIIAPAV
jgi:spoIIIJ-associated protein